MTLFRAFQKLRNDADVYPLYPEITWEPKFFEADNWHDFEKLLEMKLELGGTVMTKFLQKNGNISDWLSL